MSADNYYLIVEHPLGGYTYVMGFASDDRQPEPHPGLDSYPSAADAYLAAEADGWTEYGISFAPGVSIMDVQKDEDALAAKLEPLGGKYYGTEITVEHNGSSATLSLWLRDGQGSTEPSDRELANEGISREDWEDNVVVRLEGWDGETVTGPAQEIVEFEYSHMESQATHEMATAIVNAINQA